jgi:para-aminobenzoate synthetase component 1
VLPALPPAARFGGLNATGLCEVTDDLGALDRGGRWAVVLPYDGPPVCARFAHWERGEATDVAGPWWGPERSTWTTSADRGAYVAAVEEVRHRIAAGDVYQANVCRVLSAPIPYADRADVGGLHVLLRVGNPAPYGGFVRLPGLAVVSASPELFLSRSGDRLVSGPIKGTGRTAADLTDKDRAENVMIVDLVRNDLSAVCRTGTVHVPDLLALEVHPGLVHLVSRVAGDIRAGAGWSDIIGATFPPGSVTGAPKSSALRIIGDVETASRGVYCGAIGWVDADTREAELAVAIRTFWCPGDGTVRFGTGAGITWGSSPEREWDETELKARRLTGVAGGVWEADEP